MVRSRAESRDSGLNRALRVDISAPLTHEDVRCMWPISTFERIAATLFVASLFQSARAQDFALLRVDTFVATHGVMGTPDPDNIPGTRVNAATWTDNSNILWLFGGYGRDSA